MSRANIQKAIVLLPALTDYGIGIPNKRGATAEENEKRFRDEQSNLLSRTKEFELTCQWLSQIDKIKTINRNHSSYSLKHLAEKSIGYITNGIFIAAAINCGFATKRFGLSANVHFNMSEKSIKKSGINS